MRSGKNIPGEDTIRYMSLANREYQNRTAPLPDALDVINKKH